MNNTNSVRIYSEFFIALQVRFKSFVLLNSFVLQAQLLQVITAATVFKNTMANAY